jgi:putative tryptophan/tyrosine transport system substrate-binding protein
MRRRDFIAGLGCAAVWPAAACGQHGGKIWRIGFLAGGVRPVALESSQWSGFPQGMRELGYVEGRDFVIEWRFAGGRPERLPGLAADLMWAKVDIVVAGNPQAIRPVQEASSTMPIVMGISTDPVGAGIIASLARPGGNITGLATSADDTAPKQLELLAMAVPNLTRVGVLWNPDEPNSTPVPKTAQAAASSAGLQLVPVDMGKLQDVESAFDALTTERAEALMVGGAGGVVVAQRQQIVDLALRNRLPTIFAYREYVESGGLMSYGASFHEFNRRIAYYVDKIIKGAKPADLPVEQPTRFTLTINLKTAKALGLTLPLTLQMFATRVIE